MSESDVRLRLYMRLAAVESENLAADVMRVKNMAEAILSAPALIAIRWAKTLEDREVAQASTWHDCWIRRTETEVDRNYNELGDEAIHVGNAKAQAPLTLYDPWRKAGFKAVLYTPEGELEESAWDEAVGVLKARVLPDGSEVHKIWIVVPLRDHAIAAHQRIVAAGFDGAVYPEGAGQFWDPVPKGPWLSQSTDVKLGRE